MDRGEKWVECWSRWISQQVSRKHWRSFGEGKNSSKNWITLGSPSVATIVEKQDTSAEIVQVSLSVDSSEESDLLHNPPEYMEADPALAYLDSPLRPVSQPTLVDPVDPLYKLNLICPSLFRTLSEAEKSSISEYPWLSVKRSESLSSQAAVETPLTGSQNPTDHSLHLSPGLSESPVPPPVETNLSSLLPALQKSALSLLLRQIAG
jgi:hypothetical protein